MSSVIPASITTIRPQPGTLAHVEHARHDHARTAPPGTARAPSPGDAGAEPAGIAASSRAASSAKRAGGGTVPGIAHREPAAHVERVHARPAGGEQREQREAPPHGVAPRVHRAQLRADVEVDARGSAAAPSSGVAASAAVSSVSVIPNLLAPWPTASPAWVSGDTSGLSRSSTSSGAARRAPARPAPAIAASASSSSALSTATQRRGSPVDCGPHGGSQVGGGLADPLERDPGVREARAPARHGPLAARDHVGVEAHRRPAARPPRARRSP